MKQNGFNNFDLVYYINLEHRTDRLEHIMGEIKKTNIDESKVNRIEGIYCKEFGPLGCSKSHCLALETFLNSPEENQTCVILEDDFEFTKNQDVVNDLSNKLFNELPEFDVVMLSSNVMKDLKTNFDFVTKILDSQTLSGYVVSRQFALILFENFKKGCELLESTKIKDTYAVDMFMKQLQPSGNWYCLNPKIGKQMESYSDNEMCSVNYNC
jgi:GR25 family glycosyltransferase involved in LPS biosynthesis